MSDKLGKKPGIKLTYKKIKWYLDEGMCKKSTGKKMVFYLRKIEIVSFMNVLVYVLQVHCHRNIITMSVRVCSESI